ncbi:MAG: hypothetical protein R3B07_26100 [Polyangiaceae bacterium]
MSRPNEDNVITKRTAIDLVAARRGRYLDCGYPRGMAEKSPVPSADV